MILTNDMIDEMWIRFKEIGQQSLSMSHYELPMNPFPQRCGKIS